jgi:hypothetical protein
MSCSGRLRLIGVPYRTSRPSSDNRDGTVLAFQDFVEYGSDQVTE